MRIGRRRGSPGCWAPQVGSWSACEGATAVREVMGSKEVSNSSGLARVRRSGVAAAAWPRRRGRGSAELCVAMAWQSEVAAVLWQWWRGEIRSQ